MCGIIGFAGNTEAVPILLDGLERLEYRGYDSAGVAVVSTDGRLQIKKCRGRLGVLREALAAREPLTGQVGIGHTPLHPVFGDRGSQRAGRVLLAE